ncbi:LysR family transcriptional regulator [Rheinheimera riviphila]|nr:LysR family transcriptional regulator [Rheinheimera riviphila]
MQSLNTLTLHYLQAFVLSAELGSVSAAARALGKRQSQVSSWVQELEAELAIELFSRSGNSLQLSAAGATLLPLAQHTLAQSGRLQAAASALQQHQILVLKVGVALHIPQPILTEAIVSFIQQQPQVQIHLCTKNESLLMEGLLNREFDMVLLHESVELHNSRYDYCRVGHYDEVMVARAGHPLAAQHKVSPADLAPFRELICATDHQQQLEESGYSGHFSLIDDFSTLRTVLLNTDSIALLPRILIQNDLQQGMLVPLPLSFELSPIRRRLELRWPLGGQHHQLVGCWLALVQQTLSNLHSDTPLGRSSSSTGI